jgi:hypothetical protein
MRKAFLITLTLSLIPWAVASDDHIAPEDYLQRVFAGAVPDSDTIWLTGENREIAERILGHKPDYLRVRYWQQGERSAWILDEIGKTEPITIGVVVNGKQVEEVEVLAFRESRGWEIKHDFFKRQFEGVSLSGKQRLDRNIDGISGATLSVNAMTNISRLVLHLAGSISS